MKRVHRAAPQVTGLTVILCAVFTALGELQLAELHLLACSMLSVLGGEQGEL